jgi:hypothetical protein
MSCSRLAVKAALLIVALAAASAAFAEDPNLNPASASAVMAAARAEGGIGGSLALTAPDGTASQRSATWIDATKFGGRLDFGTPQLSYASYQYYEAPGAVDNLAYFAPVELEPGVLVDMINCIYNNSSETNNMSGSLLKYSTDFSTTPPTRTGNVLVSWSGTLNEGIAYRNASLATPETIKYRESNTLANTYHLRVDVAGDTSFNGCYVFWTRQVSPKPAVATFGDVPLTHPFSKFVEALAASGVTAGCGSGNYCPDAPLTRGQMAVFLSIALGLYWNY